MTRKQRGEPDLPPGPARDLVALFRLLRNRRKITVGQLAVGTGLTPGHISEVLRGWKTPSPNTAAVIARALGADEAAGLRARRLAEDLAELNRYNRARRRDAAGGDRSYDGPEGRRRAGGLRDLTDVLAIWADIGETQDEHAWARSSVGLADIAWLQRQTARAEFLYLQALHVFQRIKDRWGQADALRKLGTVSAQSSLPEAARAYWAQARQCLEQLGADQAADEITVLLASLDAADGEGGGGPPRQSPSMVTASEICQDGEHAAVGVVGLR